MIRCFGNKISAAFLLAILIAELAVAQELSAQASAQPQHSPMVGMDEPSTIIAPVVARDSVQAVIPKMTPVVIEIVEPLGSRTSSSLDKFRIVLARPIIVDGVEIMPAGIEGEGEVVHAKKASGMGAAGELVLAARYLNLGDRRLKLRSMRLVASGQDAINAVDSYNAAAAGAAVFTPLPLGLLGFAITGKNILVPKGTVALAKTAEDFAMIFVPSSRDDVAQDDSQDLSSQE